MVKFKLMFNKDKETEYLNEMAAQGYAMTGFFAGFYTFDRCRPGEYVYQVDITEGMFRVNNDYREFMWEMGVEIVCIWGMWVILRKKAAEGPFVLYTDVESTIEHYEKIKKMFKIATILELSLIVVELVGAATMENKADIGMPLGFACLLAAFVVAFIREISRVEGILRELRERTGAESPGKERKGKGLPSGFLSLGLILNGIGCLIPRAEEGGWLSILQGPAKWMLHGLALVLVIAGLVFTMRQHGE